MLRAFQKHWFELTGIRQGNWLLALSGGMDSVALFHLLIKTGIVFEAAHVNYGLRASESAEDQRFVELLCEKHKIRLHLKKVEPETIVKSNIQEWARNTRYEWFHDLDSRYHYEGILVAQHADDQLETILMKLFRGAAWEGWSGMQAKKGKLIRPLLPFTKEQLRLFVKIADVKYREDSSNNSDKYLRNQLRLKLIPVLMNVFPDARQHMLSFARRSNDYLEMVADWMQNAEATFTLRKDGVISIPKLQDHPLWHIWLAEYLFRKGFHEDQINQFLSRDHAGATIQSESFVLLRDREKYLLKEKESLLPQEYQIDRKTEMIEEPLLLTFERQAANEFSAEGLSEKEAWFDYEKLKFPLLLRKWKKRDCFYPFGGHGRKLLSDFFTDQKMSMFEKKDQWLLCSGEDIIWIVGRRTDHRYRITETTRDCLQVTLL